MSESKPNTTTNNGSVIQQEEKKIVRPSIILVEWDAPERMFKAYSREFYRKIAIIILFFAIIFLVLKEFLLVGVLGVVFFAIYVFHTIPPRKVRHQITTNGINYASEHLYKWEELQSFFIEKKEDTNILNVNTVEPLPGRIFLLLDESVDLTNLQEIINERISIIEDPQMGTIDQMMLFFKSKFGDKSK